MDLSKITQELAEASERAVWMPLLHPGTGKPLRDSEGNEPKILIQSRKCKQFVEATKARGYQLLAERYNGKLTELQDKDFANYEKWLIAQHVDLTKDWQHIGLDGNGATPCNKANIQRLYKEDWVIEQVLAWTDNLANFGFKDDEESAPADMVEDIEKKSLIGVDGGSPSPSVDVMAQTP